MQSPNSIAYHALVKSDRVHGSVYLDPAIFEDEMEKIFVLIDRESLEI